jgi:hypothetical protein
MTDPRNPLEVVEEALAAALDYIDENPCDPDITVAQELAWQRLEESGARAALALVRKMRADAVVGTHHDALVEALREIAKAEGPYARDRLQHAQNTIEHVIAIAEAALASLTDEGPSDG